MAIAPIALSRSAISGSSSTFSPKGNINFNRSASPNINLPDKPGKVQDLDQALANYRSNNLDLKTIEILLLKKNSKDGDSDHRLEVENEHAHADNGQDLQGSSNNAVSEVRVEAESSSVVNIQTARQSVSFSVTVKASFRFQFSLESSRSQIEPEPEQSDPLVIDLDGNGFQTTGIENGVNFDLDADGVIDRISTSTSDPFLALDLNNNGTIDDGKELFGDQNGAANGFIELAKYDDNQDGIIDKNDEIFNQLQLVYLTQNGQTSQQVSSSQVKAIYLDTSQNSAQLNDAQLVETSVVELENNQQTQAGELLLGHRQI